MRITISSLRAAGFTDAQIVRAIEAAEKEQILHRREKNRKYKQNQRSRHQIDADGADSTLPLPSSLDGSPITPPINSPSIPSSPNGLPRDARTALFNDGLATLVRISGRTETSCRALIGKWLKAATDDAIAVHGAIDDAARERVANPVAWIWASFRKNGANGNGYHRETLGDRADRLAAEARRLERAGGIGRPDDAFGGH